MSNVLSEEKKQQVIALGKLGWTLRRIEQATGVRRETASAYLRAGGRVGGKPGGWGRGAEAKRAKGVITDSGDSKLANEGEVITDSGDSKPANEGEVITDFIRSLSEKQPLALPPPT